MGFTQDRTPWASLEGFQEAVRRQPPRVRLAKKSDDRLGRHIPSQEAQQKFAQAVVLCLAEGDFYRAVSEPNGLRYDAYAKRLPDSLLRDFELEGKPTWYIGITRSRDGTVLMVSIHRLRKPAELASGRVLYPAW